MDRSFLTKLWCDYQKSLEQFRIERDAWWAEFLSTLEVTPMPECPVKPDVLIGLTCGAKTRAGTPCKRQDLHVNGRCRLHGGLSTGPKTAEGKKASSRNGRMKSRSKPHEDGRMDKVG